MKNFLDAVLRPNYKLLHAEMDIGARSADFCHLANIAYRVGRSLRVEQSGCTFVDSTEANAMFTRNYREPYVVPQQV